MTKISIIIPVYNPQIEYLKECLNSAIQQKEDIEIILIDNASSKNCSLVLQEYKNSNSKIKLIRFSKNKGYSGACNAGIEISQGEYLLFLDSDDILAPQICKTIIQHLNKHPSEICFFPFNIIDAQTKKILSTYTPPSITESNGYIPAEKILNNDSFAYHQTWNKIYKSSWIKQKEIKFSEKLPNILVDKLFTFTCLSEASLISEIITEPLYYYRVNSKDGVCSQLSSKNCSYIKEFFIFAQSMYQLSKNKNLILKKRIISEVFISFLTLFKNIHKTQRKSFLLKTKKLLKKYDFSLLEQTKFRDSYILIRKKSWKKISLNFFKSYQFKIFGIPFYKKTISGSQIKKSFFWGIIKLTSSPQHTSIRIFKINIKHKKKNKTSSFNLPATNSYSEKQQIAIIQQLNTSIEKQAAILDQINKTYDILVENKIKEQMVNMKLFDEDYYTKTYPSVKKYMMLPIDHYLKIGWHLGYNPSAIFNTVEYKKRSPGAKSNPLYHFLRYGRYCCCCLSSQNPYPANTQTLNEYQKHSRTNPSKVVYTCLTGDYDNLITHRYLDPDWDYICFTNNDKLLKEKKFLFWKIRPLVRNDLDNVRLNRYHKINPHIILPEYEESIYIDANVNILTPYLFELIKFLNKDLLVPKLNFQDCIYQHLDFIKQKRWDEASILENWKKLLIKQKFPPHYGMTENNVIYRKHNKAPIKDIMAEWWNCVEHYSKRDQLSFSYVLWQHNINISDICFPNAREDIDNFCIIPHEKKYILH